MFNSGLFLHVRSYLYPFLPFQPPLSRATRHQVNTNRDKGEHRGGRGGGRGGHGGPGGDREKPKKENILDLGKYMDKKITVKFTGGREGWLPSSYIITIAILEEGGLICDVLQLREHLRATMH